METFLEQDPSGKFGQKKMQPVFSFEMTDEGGQDLSSGHLVIGSVPAARYPSDSKDTDKTDDKKADINVVDVQKLTNPQTGTSDYLYWMLQYDDVATFSAGSASSSSSSLFNFFNSLFGPADSDSDSKPKAKGKERLAALGDKQYGSSTSGMVDSGTSCLVMPM